MKALHITVTETLRQLADDRGFSHADLAERSGLNKTTVTRMLTGETRVTMQALQAFAQALGVRASRIIRHAETL